jgi:antitoxin component YwqK of YwqJK toxin-antitoxin module
MGNISSVNSGSDIEIVIKNDIIQTMNENHSCKNYYYANSSKEIGNHSKYWSDNTLSHFRPFKNGKLNGKSYTFTSASGGNVLLFNQTYKDGKYHGITYTKYVNSTPNICIYKNDIVVKKWGGVRNNI